MDGAARRPDRELPIGGRDRNAVTFSLLWAALPLLPRGRGPVILEVRVRFASVHNNATAKLGEIAIEDPPNPLRTSDSPDELIAVCLATFDPEPELLRRQLESLRAQSDGGWICIVSDDCSRPERLALLEAEIEGDPHFLLSRSERRLGFYRNFERVLRLARKRAPLLALCDQDDRWHPDKLATLRDAIGSRPLACSDARLTDGRGGVVSEELWPGRRFESASLASCLISNAIPGASMLLRREVAELALPFPSVPGWAFHDRWLAAVATVLRPGPRPRHTGPCTTTYSIPAVCSAVGSASTPRRAAGRLMAGRRPGPSAGAGAASTSPRPGARLRACARRPRRDRRPPRPGAAAPVGSGERDRDPGLAPWAAAAAADRAERDRRYGADPAHRNPLAARRPSFGAARTPRGDCTSGGRPGGHLGAGTRQGRHSDPPAAPAGCVPPRVQSG